MKKIIITNNDLIFNKYNAKYEIIFNENFNILEILQLVRDYVHKGYMILTHPLSGSIKPFETPFKTILIEKIKGVETLDINSLNIIEASIETSKKFFILYKERKYSENLLNDFKLIDFDLIKNCIL